MQNTKKLLFVLLCLPILFYGQRKQSNNSFENIIVHTKGGSFNKKLKKEKIKLNQLLSTVNDWFNLNDDYSFQQISSKTDKLGFTHINFEEYYKGVKVENGILMVHLKAGYVNSINGQIHALKNVTSTLKVSKGKALDLAKSKLKVSKLIQEYPTETVYLKIQEKDSYNFKLAQRVRIDSNEPFQMCHLYLDANSGEILSKVNLFYNEDTPGTADILYGGVVDITCESHNGSYRLREAERNIQTFDATNADYTVGIDGIPNSEDYESSTTDWVMSGNDQTALDVHWGMEKTYDFYLNAMDRDSYDGEGGLIKQYINPPHYQAEQGNTQNNASAYGAPYNIMLYGMGDGIQFNPLVALDVAGHEFTHLVVSNNGNGGLVYQGESGALNESFADIFGTSIEFYSNVNPDWLIGEDIYVDGITYMRSMENPNSKEHPDTYAGNHWIDTSSSFDNGGVHINSSVQNHWFYLLSEGGSGTNDNNDSYSVTGIGIEDARSIAYRNLITYLSSTASFYEAFQGSLQAADDLFGEDSQQYQSVEDAWFAVGIYEGMDIPCSGTTELTDFSGTFNDGQSIYSSDTYCAWLINPVYANQVKLTFTEFETESGYDFVRVYDGNNTSAPLLGEYSGTSLPDEITTSVGVGQMFVVFTSDPGVNYSGFEAEYEALNEPCEGNTILTENSGQVMDGSGLDNYADNSNCTWLIEPAGATQISLNFSEFDLIDGDSVKVYDGEDNTAPLLGEFSGNEIPSEIETTFGNGKMYIEFTSDATNNALGWHANYDAIFSFCEGDSELNDSTGTFTDGSGDDNYEDNSNCSWLINPENAIQITLSFSDFNTETGYDFVRVFDGEDDSATLLAAFSGNNIPESISTSFGVGEMFVRFTSDGSVNRPGWTANYTSVINEPCDGLTELNTETGILFDGLLNEDYTNNSDCSWLINVDDAAQIFLNFTEFNLEENDYVKVYDGENESATLLGEYTGSTLPAEVYTTFGNNKMFVEFTSDDSEVNTGWYANYHAAYQYCAGEQEFTAISGTINDGSDSNDYQNMADCSWLINVEVANSIQISFDYLNLEENDYVRIYDGADEAASLLAEYTNESIPGFIESSFGVNQVLVKFTSDEAGSNEGWELNYEANFSYCQGLMELTEPFGSFSDGSGDGNYENYSDCSWLINPENAIQITLDFSEFSTESGYDYVRVYDGEDNNAPLLGTFSGSTLPSELSTTFGVGEMYVEFTTDVSVTNSGWIANYTSLESEPCTGLTELNTETGILFDGLVDGDYVDNSDCSWLINVDNAAQIFLNFTEFNLEENDYVRVYDGENESATLLGEYTGNTLPVEIQTTFGNNKMFVKFTSDDSGVNSGWFANYYVGYEYCSGTEELNAASGSISDGSDSNNYQNMADCSWLINVSAATSIQIEFQDFYVQENDYLRIYDGADETASLLAEYSNESTPDYIESSYGVNQVFIKFTSDEVGTADGWELNYEANYTYCQGFTELTDGSGSFSDGSGDNSYHNYSDCSWLINPENAIQITLDFSEFSTESGFDNVRVYDGENNNAPLLGTFSGSTLPSELSTTFGVGEMFIEFTTDGSVTYSGWTANYTSLISEPCSGLTELNSETGSLFDGLIDGDYSNNSDCSWLIDVPTAAQIFLNFTEFNLEENDYVRVYDGENESATLLGEYTGSSLPAEVHTTFGNNKMFVKFTSDDSGVNSGWFANYHVGYEYCSGSVELSAASGSFSDGSFDENYQNMADCSWLINVADAQQIFLNFTELDLAENDYVRVYDGEDETAPLLGEYTVNNLPQNLETTFGNNKMFVKFTSDETGTNFGWIANYNAGFEYCSGLTEFNDFSGYFTDGSLGQNYQNNADCSWLINVDNVNYVELSFTEFNLAENDYVRVYDGEDETAPLLGEFTGNSLPSTVQTSDNNGKMFVKFTSDETGTFTGWEANYISYVEYCSGLTELTEDSGTFSDGSLDYEYLNSSNCSWLINPNNVAQIILNFTEFNTEGGYDYVRVYDGEDNSAPLIGEYSGSSIPSEISTTYGVGKMFIQFTTDGSVTYDGWTAEYTSILPEPCSGLTELTEDTGSLNDGSASGDYMNNSNCSWLIDVAGATKIFLDFSQFNLASGDYVRVYDGENESATLLGEFTGNTLPEILETTFGNNKMFVKFTSNSSGTAAGWFAEYFVSYDLCAGEVVLTNESGSFSDGSGSLNYLDNSNCSWLIDPDVEVSQIILNFNEFSTETSFDRVTVYDGPNENANVLGQFSGNILPEQLETSVGVGQMYITFTSDSSVTDDGFSATYNSVLVSQQPYCNGLTELTAASGSFSDESGNSNYISNTECTWLINPENANKITLTFSEFETENMHDFVNIYDGENANAPLLASFSGTNIPNSISTSEGVGEMFIEFMTDDTVNLGGWSASYNTILGSEDFELSNSIKMYPNPSNGMLTINSQLSYNVKFKVTDMIGKVVYTSEKLMNGSSTFDFKHLSKGVYNVEFYSKSGSSIKKLVLK
ncbi:CUB domain-containing protein [Aureivirga sp. CE67]|uniref:CUB domain-containing protein n=1 Tax=Aureivirga sp. CE67 TaxID=1788983 RepID=UPI0018CAECAF|nr:CUB domain-containing protein [Aureivirga sp. CE67]